MWTLIKEISFWYESSTDFGFLHYAFFHTFIHLKCRHTEHQKDQAISFNAINRRKKFGVVEKIYQNNLEPDSSEFFRNTFFCCKFSPYSS